MNHIIPVATKYQSVLVDNVSKIMSAFPPEKAAQLSAYNVTLIEKINLHTDSSSMPLRRWWKSAKR